MYIIVFTTILSVIFVGKWFRLWRNKRKIETLEMIDEGLVNMLNEGDSLG